MFKSTPPTLFHQLPALLKFKLHQPIPMNPRESNQLLELLTTSFRQQLDTEHGPSTTSSTNHSLANHKRVKDGRQRRHSDSGSGYTDKHMRSILTNPLFRNPSELPTNTKDPMDTFDRAVGRGMMTLPYAKACLQHKRRQLDSSLTIDLKQSMKDSGASLKVLKWLGASGNLNDNKFLDDLEFTSLLYEFMEAEGLGEVFWRWIDRDISELQTSKTRVTRLGQRIDALIKMDLKKAGTTSSQSYDEIISILGKAADKLKVVSIQQQRAVLQLAGQRFYYRMTRYPRRFLDATSLNAFETFRRILPIISIHPLDVQGIDLYHPSQPSPDGCLRYLKKATDIKRLEVEANFLTHTTTYPKILIEMSLTAAKLLLLQNRVHDATWIMDYLRTNYPVELGIKDSSHQQIVKNAGEEDSSIQFLESLGMA